MTTMSEQTPLTPEEILGRSAAEYVKLQAKMAELKAELKNMEIREKELKEYFKTQRTGELNEVIHAKYRKARFVIKFKDSSRMIMDQAAVKAEYQLLGKTVPMKESMSHSFEVIRAA